MELSLILEQVNILSISKTFLLNIISNIFPYDPYNLSAADNLYAASNWHRATCVICSNVFNVIKETSIIYDLHDLITSFKVPYFITVYEGDKSWIGRETKKRMLSEK